MLLHPSLRAPYSAFALTDRRGTVWLEAPRHAPTPVIARRRSRRGSPWGVAMSRWRIIWPSSLCTRQPQRTAAIRHAPTWEDDPCDARSYPLSTSWRAGLQAHSPVQWVQIKGDPVYEHKEAVHPGFTRRYGYRFLVWHEQHPTMESAILREKQIKASSRRRKCALIEAVTPRWRDLYPEAAGTE